MDHVVNLLRPSRFREGRTLFGGISGRGAALTGLVLAALVVSSGRPARQIPAWARMPAADLAGPTLVIHCGALYDGRSATLRQAQTVRIQGGRIRAVEGGYTAVAAGEQLIDLRAMTLMPGLIDCHVHLEHEHSADDLEHQVRDEPADIALAGAEFARLTLEAGFTTVRDLGGTGVNLALARAARRGQIRAPRIITAGIPLGATGGHVDPQNGMAARLTQGQSPPLGVVDSPEAGRRAVRRMAQLGAGVIKVAATGGVLSYARDGSLPQLSAAELSAIVAAARDAGLPIAAHAHGAEGIRRALEAGVTSIEHGSLMDEAGRRLFLKTGAYYVPTLTAGRSVTDSAHKPGHFPEVIAAKALAIGPRMMNTFSLARRAGVKIAFGTDAGVFRHGLGAIEFGYMVEGGMTPLEALHTATAPAATLLGLADEIGTVEAGRMADLIACPGDPSRDVAALRDIAWVMQGGRIVHQRPAR